MSKLTETRTRQKKSGRDPRKHHYVPVFYQKHFANPDGLLWVYDRQQRTFKELHPLAICFEKDLYALKPEDKPRDTRVETKVLALVDALGAMGIRDFQTGKANREAEEQVAFFMAFSTTEYQLPAGISGRPMRNSSRNLDASRLPMLKERRLYWRNTRVTQAHPLR